MKLLFVSLFVFSLIGLGCSTTSPSLVLSPGASTVKVGSIATFTVAGLSSGANPTFAFEVGTGSAVPAYIDQISFSGNTASLKAMKATPAGQPVKVSAEYGGSQATTTLTITP